MQHGTVFGAVDLLTGEHGFDGVGQLSLFRQILQLRQRFFGNAVFGEIHQHQVIEGRGELIETIGIFREQVRDGDIFHFIIMFL
ncbi:Uncharacterised protein [Enterobacter ludwigii]|nr:Uncharacterised protein [Enterobacter ludwigii]